MRGGNSDNIENRKRLRKESLKKGTGPAYWESWHGKSYDGQYVTTDPFKGNEHRRVHPGQERELKNRFEYDWRGQKIIGGLRPSKRKSVK